MSLYGESHRAKHDVSNITTMANIDNNIQQYFDDINDVELTSHEDYKLYKIADVVASMNLKEEEEKLMFDIINDLEKFATANIKMDKVVSIPYMGCIRNNMILRDMRNNQSIKIARKVMDSADFKKFAAETYQLIVEKHFKSDDQRIIEEKVKSTLRKQYEMLFNKFGSIYTTVWIKTLTHFKGIEFDQEWEDKYQELKSLDKNK